MTGRRTKVASKDEAAQGALEGWGEADAGHARGGTPPASASALALEDPGLAGVFAAALLT